MACARLNTPTGRLPALRCTIGIDASCSRNKGEGVRVRSTTVCSSAASNASRSGVVDCISQLGSSSIRRTRRKVAMASSAVTGSPLWKRAERSSRNIQVRASIWCQERARAGCAWPSAPISVKHSNTLPIRKKSASTCCSRGSSAGSACVKPMVSSSDSPGRSGRRWVRRSGSHTVMRVPLPSSLSTLMLPPRRLIRPAVI